MFIFERERERETECEKGEGQRERDGDTESEAGSRLQAVSTEPPVWGLGLEHSSCEIMT